MEGGSQDKIEENDNLSPVKKIESKLDDEEKYESFKASPDSQKEKKANSVSSFIGQPVFDVDKTEKTSSLSLLKRDSISDNVNSYRKTSPNNATYQ